MDMPNFKMELFLNNSVQTLLAVVSTSSRSVEEAVRVDKPDSSGSMALHHGMIIQNVSLASMWSWPALPQTVMWCDVISCDLM